MSTTVDNMATVAEAWGPEIPDWIMILARACDATSQRKVADRIGYSGSLVNQVMKRRYKGDLTAVEQAVRGALMNAVLACPTLGEMPTHTCLDWQKKANTFANVNPQRVRMFRACRSCPHSRIGGNNA